ncbi:MAG: pyridoxal phosphate-dependent aminotransferase [Deltaproteobacteria bacterium]|nr:pyridoxal phosphate-dependent aminotransferase [Deltaproteobacteria bacterium]
MAISRKIEGFMLKSSWIRRMFEDGIKLKEKYGAQNVFDFSLGNPNVDPPDRFKELLMEIAGEGTPGAHKYMPNVGYERTRAEIAAHLSGEHSVALSSEHVIMTCGAGGALNVVFKTLLDPGDEVIISKPFFVEYTFYVDNHGGVPVFVETNEDFSLNLDAIEGAITEKTKVILINSPNNPTGKVYDEESIEGLSLLIERKERELGKEIYLVSDEPYSTIAYDGIKVPSILNACKNSLMVTSYSKSLSVPGERIGYIAVSPVISDIDRVIDGITLCNRILGFVNAPAFMQRVVERMQGIYVDVEHYRRKRDLLCDGLWKAGFEFEKPDGAFYLFPRTPIDDDVEFVRALQEKNILVVPGSGFGGPGHIRISYCVDDSTIINSMDGFEAVMKKYRNG